MIRAYEFCTVSSIASHENCLFVYLHYPKFGGPLKLAAFSYGNVNVFFHVKLCESPVNHVWAPEIHRDNVETLLSSVGELVSWRRYNAACSKKIYQGKLSCICAYVLITLPRARQLFARKLRDLSVTPRTCCAAFNLFCSARFVIDLSHSVYIRTSLTS